VKPEICTPIEFVRRIDRLGANFLPLPDFGLMKHGFRLGDRPGFEEAQVQAVASLGQYGIAADVFNTEKEARAFMAGLSAARLNDEWIVMAEPFHAAIEPSRVVYEGWIVLWRSRGALSRCILTDHKF
jgi:hypothetical protein